MRGHIKGTDSTINATAVLYELTARSKIQFVIKTVMTNTVEFTEWPTNLLRHRIRSYTTGFLELGCGLEA